MSSRIQIQPAGHTEHAFSATVNEGKEGAVALEWPNDGIFEIGPMDILTIRAVPPHQHKQGEEPATKTAEGQ